MKKLSVIFVLATSMLIACQNSSSAKIDEKKQATDSTSLATDSIPDQNVNSVSEQTPIIKDVLDHYLELKNALTSDGTKEAASAGEKMFQALSALPTSSLTADEQKEVKEIVDDAKEHAEHIGENAGNIKHQREHFQELSTEMYDLLKLLGTSQKVYKDSCPMVKAIWISEKEEIVNPYYGKKMLTCGTIQETIER